MTIRGGTEQLRAGDEGPASWAAGPGGDPPAADSDHDEEAQQGSRAQHAAFHQRGRVVVVRSSFTYPNWCSWNGELGGTRPDPQCVIAGEVQRRGLLQDGGAGGAALRLAADRVTQHRHACLGLQDNLLRVDLRGHGHCAQRHCRRGQHRGGAPAPGQPEDPPEQCGHDEHQHPAVGAGEHDRGEDHRAAGPPEQPVPRIPRGAQHEQRADEVVGRDIRVAQRE